MEYEFATFCYKKNRQPQRARLTTAEVRSSGSRLTVERPAISPSMMAVSIFSTFFARGQQRCGLIKSGRRAQSATHNGGCAEQRLALDGRASGHLALDDGGVDGQEQSSAERRRVADTLVQLLVAAAADHLELPARPVHVDPAWTERRQDPCTSIVLTFR